MNRKRDRFKMVLTFVLAFLSISLAIGGTLVADAAGDNVTVEPVGGSEWKIINPEGDFVGSLKSEDRKSFKFYDTSGTFIGTIIESKAWFHRLYHKRNTQVTPDEARLYLEALKAIEAIQ